MSRSLRRTLAVRFAATMGVGLVAASVAAYCASFQVLRRQLDHGLAAAAFLAAEHFDEADERLRLEPLITSDRARYERDVNRYIVLRGPNGQSLSGLPQFAAELPLDTAAFGAAREGTPVWTDQEWHDRPIRSLYTPLTRGGGNDGRVLQVATLLQPIVTLRWQLLLVLIGVVLLGSGATLIGAWRLAGSAVRPVSEITQQATRIEVGTLDQRIAAHVETDEYRGLVAVLNRMLERLERAFRSQRRLTADVSHELRSPLTVLRGEIEVALRAERTPRDYQRVLHSALEEIDRLTAMSEDLLLITRAEAHLLQVRRVPSDVNAIIERALDLLRGPIEERELVVERHLAPEASSLPVDPGLVARLVQQLLDNAVKFTPAGGRVRVTTVPLDGPGGVRLSVEDSGPGIAPGDLPHMFEPFYRADQARSRDTGVGLGLAMAAAIARLHGGTIRAANVPGDGERGAGGARFEVVLPASNQT